MHRLVIETLEEDFEKFLDRLDLESVGLDVGLDEPLNCYSDTEHTYVIEHPEEDVIYEIMYAFKQLNRYFGYKFSLDMKKV